jgi:NADH:ubiquinone oxidoreductase subunit B-like Fe-S oxidoreductase
MVAKRGAYWVLVGKPEERIPLGRPRHKWEDNIKTHLREMRCWARTGSIWFKIETGVACCECGNEPSGSTECGEFHD